VCLVSSNRNEEDTMKRIIVIGLAAAALAAIAASAASAGSVKRLPAFRSPTGNIKCMFVPGSGGRLLCSIGRADYAAKAQAHCMGPTGAGVDWHGFSLNTARRGSLVCSGGILYDVDRERPSYVTLPYGKSWSHGAFTCRSRVSGVTCRSRSGHGLFVSRQAYRLW
jgi:hypothetical protein